MAYNFWFAHIDGLDADHVDPIEVTKKVINGVYGESAHLVFPSNQNNYSSTNEQLA